MRRIQDYLAKVRDYVRTSKHPEIKLAVLEWSLCHTYDWRAGLHTAGALIGYEKLSPDLAMTCPALLMRNTTDDPNWRAWIYHDHVSWFPGSGYVVEKLFREHYAEKQLASTTGTSRDIPNRSTFFDDISQMKPEGWKPGTLDALATASANGKRIVIKAVNYEDHQNTLLLRLQGSHIPANAKVIVYTVSAGLTDAPSMNNPNLITPTQATQSFARDMSLDLKPYSVAVMEISGEVDPPISPLCACRWPRRHSRGYLRKASCNPPSTVMIWPVVLLRRRETKRKYASAWSAGEMGDFVKVRSA